MHILKLRKNRKVLQIPDFTNLSQEEKFCKIMLYFPIKPGQKIDTERLGTHLLSIIYYSLFLPSGNVLITMDMWQNAYFQSMSMSPQ